MVGLADTRWPGWKVESAGIEISGRGSSKWHRIDSPTRHVVHAQAPPVGWADQMGGGWGRELQPGNDVSPGGKLQFIPIDPDSPRAPSGECCNASILRDIS